jgi:hypothetical protein
MKRILFFIFGLLFSNAILAVGDSSIVATLSTTVGTTYNQAKFNVSIHFDQKVNDIDLTLIKVINGYAINLKIGPSYGQDWLFDVYPSSQGRVGVYIPAGAITNNPDDDTWNAGSDTLWVYIDYNHPTFSLASTAPNPTNQTQIDVQITSSEYITDFTLDDIFIANANVVSFTNTQANRGWNLSLSVIQDGDVKVVIPEAKVLDTAANINYVSDTLKRRFDTTPPHVLLSTAVAALSNLSSITLTIDFDEAITGFDASDFSFQNATLISLISSGTNKYTATIAPVSNGAYSVYVPASSVADLLGNLNPVSNTLNFTYDNIVPQCTLTSTSASPTANDTLNFSVQFSEPMSSFTTAAIYISAGQVVNLKNTIPGTAWSYQIVNTLTRSITSNIKANAVKDLAGNFNLVSNSLTIETDHTSPTCSLYTTASNPTNKDSILIIAGFSEPVINFGLDDITITGGSVKIFSGIAGDKQYSFYAYPQIGKSLMIISVKDSSYNDVLGHYGSKFTSLFIEYDIQVPTVSLSSSLGAIVHIPFDARFKFSETVQNFIKDSLHVENGKASIIYESQTGLEWTATITPTAKGQVKVWLGKSSAIDKAGNYCKASDTLKVEYNDDVYAPIPTLTTEVLSPTNSKLIPVYIEFDEEVTGFTVEDVNLINAIASNFQQIVANKKWKINLVPLTDGSVQAQVKSVVCEDLSGNTNAQSNVLLWQEDMTAPKVALSTTSKSPSNIASFNIKFSFSEDVDSFDIHDVIVKNGVLSALSVVSEKRVWSATISNMVSDGQVSVSVRKSAAYDIAKNGSLISDTVRFVYDGTAPTINFSSYLKTDSTYSDTATIFINFSEVVLGFLVTNLSFTNATLASSTIITPGLLYTVKLKATTYGTFGLRVPFSAVHDAVGNVNMPNEKVLNYVKKASSVANLNNAGLQHYVSERNLYLFYQKTILKPDELMIYDLNGRLVLTQKLIGQSNYVIPLNFAEGIYLVRLLQNNINYVDKIYVGKE